MLERIQWRFGIGTEANQHFRAEAFPPPAEKEDQRFSRIQVLDVQPLGSQNGRRGGSQNRSK